MSETIENPRYDLDGDRRTYVTFIDANGEKIVTGVLPGHIVPHWQKEVNGKFGVHTGEFITDPDGRNIPEIQAKQDIITKYPVPLDE